MLVKQLLQMLLHLVHFIACKVYEAVLGCTTLAGHYCFLLSISSFYQEIENGMCYGAYCGTVIHHLATDGERGARGPPLSTSYKSNKIMK